MPYNTKKLITDASNQLPAPQYYNPTIDQYEASQGSGGAPYFQSVGSNQLIGAIQKVTTSGTHIQLPSNPCREVTLIGLPSNTGLIYVGGNNVSSSVYGATLSAKDSITLAVNNTNLIWIDSSVNGEGISYVAI